MAVQPWCVLAAVGAACSPAPSGDTADDEPFVAAATPPEVPAPVDLLSTTLDEDLLVAPPAIASESSWCWTVAPVSGGLTPLGLFAVGMDSGTDIQVGAYGEVEEWWTTRSIAYTGSSLVFAVWRTLPSWYHLDLATGDLTEWDAASWAFTTLAGLGSNLVTRRQGNIGDLYVYDDVVSLSSDEPLGSLAELVGGELFTQFQFWQGLLYTDTLAWSLDPIQVFEPSTGALIDQIALGEFEYEITGPAVAGGMVHVMEDTAYQSDVAPTIHRFDLDGVLIDGVALNSFGPLVRASGLWCDGP